MAVSFDDFIDHKTRRELESQFRKIDVEAEHDSWDKWRVRLNHALSDIGVSIAWADEIAEVMLPASVDQIVGKIRVPIRHLEDLYEQEANPKAVSLYLKCLFYDDRFKLWVVEDE